MQPAIDVRGLTKSYGAIAAVNGVDLEVRSGEVFGLLGPNGAGKTSIIEILEGLRSRSGGSVSVLGIDPERESRKLRDRIGVCLQATNLPDRIKVREAIELFASFYSKALDVSDLLGRLELQTKAGAYYQHLSGGQKQRLALALALVNDPAILFLDEPTAGLDPQARRAIHELVRGARAGGRTVVVSTHYIEEAERLCDRVAIVDGGKVIALGTPDELKARALHRSAGGDDAQGGALGAAGAGGAVIEIRFAARLEIADSDAIEGAEGDRVVMREDGLGITVISIRPARSLAAVMRWLDQRGVEPVDVTLARPSLEDVFIELTGRSLRDE